MRHGKLEEMAVDILSDAIDGMKNYDKDEIADRIPELVQSAADSAVTYYADCQEYLGEYEAHKYTPNESSSGVEYRADQYREAMTAWAYEVVSDVLGGLANDLLEDVDGHAEELIDAVNDREDIEDSIDESDLIASRECTHGWASHNKEDETGVMYWTNKQLDGLNGMAINTGPFWLSYTWTPVED